MSNVEMLSLKLTEEQRERFLLLVAANPETPPRTLFLEVVSDTEELK
jgi:hypothetical protein